MIDVGNGVGYNLDERFFVELATVHSEELE